MDDFGGEILEHVDYDIWKEHIQIWYLFIC